MIQDSDPEPGFGSGFLDSSGFPDSDPDVCRIAPEMLWIHYLVGVSHFTLRRVSCTSIGDCMRNANKSPKIFYSAVVKEVEK